MRLHSATFLMQGGGKRPQTFAYVAFLLIGAATALPALCSFKSVAARFGTFGVNAAAPSRKDSKV